jgi:serine/threonine-protein kinase RsbW
MSFLLNADHAINARRWFAATLLPSAIPGDAMPGSGSNLLRLSFNSFNTLLDISRFICANDLEIQLFKNRRDLASPLPLERGMTRRFQVRFKERAQADPLGGRSSSPSIELQHSFSSIIAGIRPSVDLVMRFVSKFRKQDGSEANIEMALHEALTNAVVHGNHEDPYKLVHVACRCSIDGQVSITIRDQGQGFDTRAVPDPTTTENLLSTHGRGIYLMQALMDEVSFDEGGVVVHMCKKPNAGPDAAE